MIVATRRLLQTCFIKTIYLIRLTGNGLSFPSRDVSLLLNHKLQTCVVGNHVHHVKTLFCIQLCLFTTCAVDTAFFTRFLGTIERLCQGSLEFVVYDAVDDGVANVVPCIGQMIALRIEETDMPRSNGPKNRASIPATAANSSTASKASRVSI